MKQDKDLEKISKFFASVTDLKTVKEIFKLFFTESERDFLETRFLIIEEILDDKLTQREIAKKLQVSIAKITAGSKAVKKMPGYVKNLF